jgi:ribosomal 30S subunit maturation factor RimM
MVTSSREFRGRWVVTLDGVTTMNDAETLRGLELRVPADALQVLGPDAHYVHDLEGCAVVTTAGEEVGRVTRVQFGSGAPLAGRGCERRGSADSARGAYLPADRCGKQADRD